MAQWQNDAIFDNGTLEYLRLRATRVTLCSAQPSSYQQATSTTGVMLAQTGVLTSTDFTLGDGDSGGRKIRVAAKSGLSIVKTGTMTHAAWVGSSGSTLLAVTTVRNDSLYVNGLVDMPAHDFEMGDIGEFYPSSLSGIEAWYDFSDDTTVFTDETFSTNTGADGYVGGVLDKSGNHHHLTQELTPDATYKAIYRLASVNGLNSAEFDDALTSLKSFVESSALGYSGFSVFVVVVTDNTNTTRYIWGTDNDNIVLPRRQFGGILFDEDVRLTSQVAITSTTNPVPVDGSACLIEWQKEANGSTSYIRVDGTEVISGDTQGTTDYDWKFLSIGISPDFTSGNAFDGKICEIIMSYGVTASERTSIQNYLNTKWGI